MPTRRATLLTAAGLVAAGVLGLPEGPPPALSQQPLRKASFDQNEIERLISRAAITAKAKSGYSFNVKVNAGEYTLEFHLQLERNRGAPHYATLDIGIQQSDGLRANASLGQASAGAAIEYPLESGWGKVLASRPDTPTVFTNLFVQGRRVADELLKHVPKDERVTFDPTTNQKIRDFAKQLLSAAWLANPNHPNHFRQVSQLKIGLK